DDLAAKMMALRPASFGQGGGANRGGGDSTRRRGGAGAFGGGANRQPGDTMQRRGGRGGGSPEMQAINEQMRAIYTTLNIDPRAAATTTGSHAPKREPARRTAGSRWPGRPGRGRSARRWPGRLIKCSLEKS